MRLTDANVAIRPRPAWEALDLGTLMARRQFGLLTAGFALVSLPVLALLSLLLWQHPTWAVLIFWWLKPAFDRLPLYILSRSLFRDPPTLREALKAYPGLLRPQLLTSLTWRRFSPHRSFYLPVQQLEGLGGTERRRRIGLLGQRDSGTAAWLTLGGALIELCLYLGLIALLYSFLPPQLASELDWQKLLGTEDGEWLWVEHLTNWLYALALVIWEPIYVACGFSLYLNRRTVLEAWDIELAFRRLRQRLTGSAYLLLVVLTLGLFSLPETTLAEDTTAPTAEVQRERLVNQPLTSKQAQQAIQALVEAPPFRHTETVTRWRLSQGEDRQKAEDDGDSRAKSLLEKLFKLRSSSAFDSLLLILKVALWAILIGLVVLLAWRYREWLETFARRLRLPVRRRREPPQQLFGLEVSPESLPEDIAGSAEALWESQPREALGLLYRALLSRLLHHYRLPLKSSHTEGEVLMLVERLGEGDLHAYSGLLTGHWQNLAYGHRLPGPEVRDQLCTGWRAQFAEDRP